MPQATARRSNLRAVRREIPTKRKSRSARLKVLAAIAAGAALLGMVAFVYRSRTVAEESVALIRGAVEITQSVDGLVVRKEQVYPAPASGQVRRLAAQGERVRVGASVAQILDGPATAAAQTAPAVPAPAPQPQGDTAVRRQIDQLTASIYEKAVAHNKAKANGDSATADRLQAELDQLAVAQRDLTLQMGRSQPVIVTPPPPPPAEGPAVGEIKAAASGVVIYQTDGLEAQLSPAQEAGWAPATVRSLIAEPRDTPQTVQKGDPVLKIVDNLSLSLLAVVPEAILSRLGDTGQVFIRFAGREGPPVTARVARQVREGGDALLVLTAPVFPEELVHQRRFRATLVLGTYEGLVVPRTAVDVRNGLQGVWVVDGAETRFHPVRVAGGSDDLLALETDLAVGTRVLKQAPTDMR